MLKERRGAAEKITRKLRRAEDAIEIALTRTAEVASAASTSRRAAGLSALYGQDALQELSQSYAALLEGRGKMVAAHKHFDTIKDQIGLRAVSFGSGVDKPSLDARPTENHLRQVASVERAS